MAWNVIINSCINFFVLNLSDFRGFFVFADFFFTSYLKRYMDGKSKTIDSENSALVF